LQTTDTKQENKRKAVIGRPTIFTDELGEEICRRMEEGTTLFQICLADDMPARTSVYDWRDKFPAFADRFTRARVRQMHSWADETVHIADDGTTDYITKKGRNGQEYEAFDSEHVQRSKLRVDTRLRLMAVIAPHVYGEKVSIEHTGDITVQHELSDRETMRRMALFLLEDRAAGVLIDGEATIEEAEQQTGTSCQPIKG